MDVTAAVVRVDVACKCVGVEWNRRQVHLLQTAKEPAVKQALPDTDCLGYYSRTSGLWLYEACEAPTDPVGGDKVPRGKRGPKPRRR